MRSMVEREAPVVDLRRIGASAANSRSSLSDPALPGHLCLRERKVRPFYFSAA